MWRTIVCFLALGIAALPIAGCQSSGVAQRKAQSIEEYQSLNAATRRLVDKGKIQNGMDTNAVFIAWGQPTDVFAVDIPDGGTRLIWNYETRWAYEGKRLVPRGNDLYGRPIYGIERWRQPINYVAKSVTFASGKVIEWKKYDPPVFDQPPGKPRYSPHAF